MHGIVPDDSPHTLYPWKALLSVWLWGTLQRSLEEGGSVELSGDHPQLRHEQENPVSRLPLPTGNHQLHRGHEGGNPGYGQRFILMGYRASSRPYEWTAQQLRFRSILLPIG